MTEIERSEVLVLVFASAKSSNEKSIPVYAHNIHMQAGKAMFTWCMSATISLCVCVCVCMCLCIYDRGGRFGWMSHIVPVRPSDIAGGQRGMEPERGDSDK